MPMSNKHFIHVIRTGPANKRLSLTPSPVNALAFRLDVTNVDDGFICRTCPARYESISITDHASLPSTHQNMKYSKGGEADLIFASHFLECQNRSNNRTRRRRLCGEVVSRWKYILPEPGCTDRSTITLTRSESKIGEQG